MWIDDIDRSWLCDVSTDLAAVVLSSEGVVSHLCSGWFDKQLRKNHMLGRVFSLKTQEAGWEDDACRMPLSIYKVPRDAKRAIGNSILPHIVGVVRQIVTLFSARVSHVMDWVWNSDLLCNAASVFPCMRFVPDGVWTKFWCTSPDSTHASTPVGQLADLGYCRRRQCWAQLEFQESSTIYMLLSSTLVCSLVLFFHIISHQQTDCKAVFLVGSS